MKTGGIDKVIRNVICEDVPNLGSIITLDNKGRLINSQFSKPSSSQTLLKLNSSEEVPDADDLPYAIISYGDTPNIINLPYNDHNYVSLHNTRKLENYDKKALDYLSKQSSQSVNRSNFTSTNSVRISHFGSYNSAASHNDSVFFSDKYKPSHQFTFNQQISHTSTPLITNKSLSSIPQNINNNNSNNNIFTANKLRPGAIVINSGSVNKLKGMNVIQLRRPTLETDNITETRIINLPLKKPSVLTNIIGSNQINGDRDKIDVNKSINLVPRCVCGFTHDDGGMIRCEICRTWQHIVCMYPDNKFPIYYKCERCEPREVDVKRAVTTQTHFIIKIGHSPSEFLAHQCYSDYDLENKFAKSNGSHIVIVKPDVKSGYRPLSDSLPNSSLPIYITASKDPQIVPPGSPRTSKRKQDLISLKSVLSKPSNTVIISGPNNKLDIQKQLLMDNQSHYNCLATSYLVPTSSTHKLQLDLSNEPYIINEMSPKLKSILSSKVQFHTNLTMYQLQYLKQNNFLINTNMYEVITIDFNSYAVKTVVEFNASEVIMEYNGYVSLTEEYNLEYDFRNHYNPFVLFYDKCERLQLCIDSKTFDNKARFVRRSCTPNAEVKHRLLQDGQIRFYVVPINRINRDSEITIAFDYSFMKCRYPVECACMQSSCQLMYGDYCNEPESDRIPDDPISRNMNIYDCTNLKLGIENVLPSFTLARPYKRRGRGSKSLHSANRQTNDSIINSPKPTVKIVRRNKRGRPPLNRAIGTQRSDVFVRPNLDSISDNNFNDSKEASDNESIQSRSNEIINSRMPIHMNFKNFKRISSSHWSLKANRKMAAVPKKSKPLKKLMISPKVGRPMKSKKPDVVKFEPEAEYLSDNSRTSMCNRVNLPLDEERNLYSNDENDCSISIHSYKPELSREEEGKYWLEEINNKINKQNVKEAKRIQRKSKHNKKKFNQRIAIDVSTFECVDNGIIMEPEYKEPIKEEEVIRELSPASPVCDETEEQSESLKKSKRGRKIQKHNISYILSYKPSNIDDLKNDLMLISASYEEDAEKEPLVQDVVKDEIGMSFKEVVVQESAEEPVQDHIEVVLEKSESNDLELDVVSRVNDPSEDKTIRLKSKRRGLNRSDGSSKDQSIKASREERWVNIMWQRILKNETSDDKSKRRRSKGSAAEESITSEDNRNESSEIGSPKVGNSDLSEDRDSSSNSKSGSMQKNNRKTKFSANENENYHGCSYETIKLMDYVDLKNEKSSVPVSTTLSVEETSLPETKQLNEQCGLIVYKEQHSNPMEKFSRENSAKLFSMDGSSEGFTIVASSGNAHHPPHTKKRWLSQALMEETFCGNISLPKSVPGTDQDITDKLTSIDNVSKRSFLPPVFTSSDNVDSMSSTIQKMAINPKKRLLNQFSMEDSALRTCSDPNYRNSIFFKLSKSEANTDQEQAKTKLSLSEYRKRRFSDKVPIDCSNIFTKFQKCSEEFNNSWVGLMSKDESEPEKERDIDADNDDINTAEGKDYDSSNQEITPLSYFDTLNNLTMPENLDPRLSKVTSILSDNEATPNVPVDLPVISYNEVFDFTKREVFETKSPSDTPNSISVGNLNKNGPRTPTEVEELSNNVSRVNCLSVGHQSEGSIHSFESQPSPTSECHFDFEKELNVAPAPEKPPPAPTTTEPWPTDWTSHSTTIGKMAGIKNPDLLQEIEEFEDEYVPMPENLPERSKEELETLLLTQKRDSQIREWQEVKQMEREKVKLDHQVRSLERRLNRANKHSGPKVATSLKSGHSTENPGGNYGVKNDERTMKAFNVQLANINGKLMEQINSLKINNASAAPPMTTVPAITTTTTGVVCTFSRHRRKPRPNTSGAAPTDDSSTNQVVVSNPQIQSDRGTSISSTMPSGIASAFV